MESQTFNLSGPVHITEIDWNNTVHQTSILSSLVKGVYILELDRQNNREGLQALAPPWWKFFNFQVQKVLQDDSDLSIYGAVYEFKSPLKAYSKLHPPRYILALRGTLLKLGTLYQDIILDVEIACFQNKLQDCPRVIKALQVVKELVDDAGAENVWLAGHSLGSAIALTVGRKTVKMGFHLETHLFNPPFTSLRIALDLITKNKILKHGARIMASALKVGLSVSLKGHHRTDDNHFGVLSSWTPYLYVNPRDPICSEYIPYFRHRKTMKYIGASRIGKCATQISLGGIITSCALGYSTETYHLIPTAYLVINKNENTDAHALAQWWTQSTDWESMFCKFS
ncbi:GDSL esterase/lipase At4g10955-like [Apium graveolens]|uniref:GDSL esterase/lipase At4g10955-like n=1 Tax=Apium graveolens TaxID=4045 RepID=UPI003D79304A